MSDQWSTGYGQCFGSCGELAQGLLPDHQHFHITCPVQDKVSRVQIQFKPSTDLHLTGIPAGKSKLRAAILQACQTARISGAEIRVSHTSDLDQHLGQGMASSTADIVAGARALADAIQEQFSPQTLAGIACGIESSDGLMYPGISAVSQKTGQQLASWQWQPAFHILMLIPNTSLDTHQIDLQAQQQKVDEYQKLWDELHQAVRQQNIQAFARAATRSALMHQQYLANPCFEQVYPLLDKLGALGANLAHTGTVCGVLFNRDEQGRELALAAQEELAQGMDDTRIELSSTPAYERG